MWIFLPVEYPWTTFLFTTGYSINVSEPIDDEVVINRVLSQKNQRSSLNLVC